MKPTTGLESVKGVVNSIMMTFLSLQLVEIDKNYWLTLPRWNSLCHRLSRDQPQPGTKGGREERPWERGWSVGRSYADVITKFSQLDGLPFLPMVLRWRASRAEAPLKSQPIFSESSQMEWREPFDFPSFPK